MKGIEKNISTIVLTACPILLLLLTGCETITPQTGESGSATSDRETSQANADILTQPEQSSETTPVTTAESVLADVEATEETTMTSESNTLSGAQSEPVQSGQAASVSDTEQGDTSESSDQGTYRNPSTQKITTQLSMPELPLLDKPVQITMTYFLREDYEHEASDATARIWMPEEMELVEGDIEWHGDVVKGETYTLEATIKSVETGLWYIDGGVTYQSGPHVLGGDDTLYIKVTEDSAEVSDTVIVLTPEERGFVVPGKPGVTFPNQKDYPPTPPMTEEDYEKLEELKQLTSYQEEKEGIQLPPAPPKELREYPNLDQLLYELIDANEQGKAEEYARQKSSIILDDGKVTVMIEAEEGLVDDALDAVRNYGTVRGKASKSGIFGAQVPIDSLIPLIQEESIQHIMAPVLPTENDI